MIAPAGLEPHTGARNMRLATVKIWFIYLFLFLSSYWPNDRYYSFRSKKLIKMWKIPISVVVTVKLYLLKVKENRVDFSQIIFEP